MIPGEMSPGLAKWAACAPASAELSITLSGTTAIASVKDRAGLDELFSSRRLLDDSGLTELWLTVRDSNWRALFVPAGQRSRS